MLVLKVVLKIVEFKVFTVFKKSWTALFIIILNQVNQGNLCDKKSTFTGMYD